MRQFDNVVSFIDCYNICSAISTDWLRILKGPEPIENIQAAFLNEILLQEKISQYVYKKLICYEDELLEKKRLCMGRNFQYECNSKRFSELF